MSTVSKDLNTESGRKRLLSTHLKMLSRHSQVAPQVSSERASPLLITRFSRQLVPERANCSLSAEDGRTQNYSRESVLSPNTAFINYEKKHASKNTEFRYSDE